MLDYEHWTVISLERDLECRINIQPAVIISTTHFEPGCFDGETVQPVSLIYLQTDVPLKKSDFNLKENRHEKADNDVPAYIHLGCLHEG
jgi:hypothetical protein